MKRMAFHTVLILSSIVGSPALGDTPVIHNFRVNRYKTGSLTVQEAKNILGQASIILREKDPPGSSDVACNVDLKLNPESVDTFDAGSGRINSASDYLLVSQQPGRVHIVNEKTCKRAKC
jgi:hypothetical protein